MRRRPPSRSAGFTLLELLIALALFGFVAVALSGGLRFAGHAIAAEQKRRVAFADLDAVENVLRRMIAEARQIEGEGDSLGFIGSLPRALAKPGLYAIRVGAVDDRLMLVWRAVPDDDAKEPGEPLGEEVLARNIAGFDLDYLTLSGNGALTPPGTGALTPSGNGAPVWRHSVDKKASPLLVRARLRLFEGDPRHWPELVVAPRIDVAPGQQ
jgi:general secretion pathway protein J